MGKEAGRQIGDAKVTPLAPDFCKTPVGSSTPPLPYFPIGSFKDSDGVAKTVFFTGKKVFTTNSHITKVMGNEPGKLGGVKSGVNKGYCVPKALYSSTFRVEGGWVIRHDSLFEMNCASPTGGGNVMGKVVYIKVTAMAYVGENGEIKAFKYEAEDTQNNTESIEFRNASDNELMGVAEQLPDDAFQNPLEADGLLSNNNPMGIEGMEYNPEFGTYEYSDNSLDDFNYDDEIVANHDVEEALNSQQAAQAELDAANAEMARLEQEAQLDATQAALGVAGLIDPTPASDLWNAKISWDRGNYGEALLDGVSAFPYIGDLFAKPFKGGIVAKRGINLARKLEKARAAKKAAMQKLADAKKQLQEAAANLKRNKKNAQNAANGKAVDAVPPKSKNSQDQVKGDGKKRKKPPKKSKGDCGERLARHWLKEQGYELMEGETGELMSEILTNASGHGIDAIGIKDGKLFIGEIKSNGSSLSKNQKKGGANYLKDQVDKMIRGIEDGKGNFKSFQNKSGAADALKTLKRKMKGDVEYKEVRVPVEEREDGDYDGDNCKKGKGDIKAKDW